MKKCISFLLTLLLFFASFFPFLQTPLFPQKVYAKENCVYYVYVGQANIHMLYQSQQQDTESSLYYLRARYYDPLLGRFISKDPVKGLLTIPQSQNPYVYALNNPVNLSDSSGLFAAGPCVSCGGGIGVYGSLSLCVVGTSGGEFGVIGSTGIGGIAGAAASINLLGGIIDFKADKLSDLEGSELLIGGSVKAGGGLGVDVGFDKKPWEPTSISGGIGPGIYLVPAEFHGGKSNTEVLVNFNDLFNNLLK